MLEKIRGVIITLNEVEVKGWKNLTAMTGCMRVLEEVALELEQNGGGQNRTENEQSTGV